MTTRRDFHFIFGLRAQTEPFHLLHYLCLASCIGVNRPDSIHFHYRHEPFGPWWDKIKPRLNLVRVAERVAGFEPQRYGESPEGLLIQRLGLEYAHEADFLRLDLLLAQGGVYADMDTLFVRPYPDAWFDCEFAIGEENAPPAQDKLMRASLCNAVLFGQPGAQFAALWRERMSKVFDGTWNRHSCDEAARVWQDAPDSVRVLPSAYFYRYGSSIAGLRSLFEECDRDHDDLFSVHLWAHLWWDQARTDFSTVHAGEIDEAWIRERDCTLARLARPYLDD
jgi:Glycosyltransferase sugar-binding region containing DXD motif